MNEVESPKPKKRKSWRRRWAWGLLAVALVAASIPVAILGSLHLPSVRTRVAGWVAHRFEAQTGAALHLQDFDLDPRRGVLEIRGLEVASIHAADVPLLTASRVRAELELPALLRGGEVGSPSQGFRLFDIHGRGSFLEGRCEATSPRRRPLESQTRRPELHGLLRGSVF